MARQTCRISFIFNEFDGHLYDRNSIVTRLSEISPRSVYAARDPSKFRDEISAYPAYLGLYKLKKSQNGWIMRLSETAKKLLVREEPDVASFMRLQLSLFQYPNGMGAAYKANTNSLRIQANVRDRTLNMIDSGVHLSPLRLICIGLKADSVLNNIDIFEASITYEEVYALSNHPDTNKAALPDIQAVQKILTDVRSGQIEAPTSFERRFHILKHTELFNLKRNKIGFRFPENEIDKNDLLAKIDAILKITNQFDGFDGATSSEELKECISNGDWGEYFDGINTLNASTVNILCADTIAAYSESIAAYTVVEIETSAASPKPLTYPLKQKQAQAPPPEKSSKKTEYADPETTRIKRERRNLAHKALIDKNV